MDDDQSVEITLRLTPAQAREFVRGLADDAFRARLEKEPAAVLEEFGITITPREVMEASVSLPPKEEVRAVIAKLDASENPNDLTNEAYGYAYYAVLFRMFPALPFIEPDGAD